jgi:hypothetical protein
VAEVELLDRLDALSADALALLRLGADFYGSAGWYETVVKYALPAGAVACFAQVRLHGRAAAVFALLRQTNGSLTSLTAPYTCVYQPAVADGLDAAAWMQIGRALAAHPALRPGLRLEALPAEWPPLAAFCRGCRQAGMLVLRFEHFGNWHEGVGGMDWPAYLAGRHGALRETLRRRSAKLLADPTVRLRMLTGPDEIEPGIEAFEAIYRRSWKQPEPYPDFNAACIRLAARQGVLRLALLSRNDAPIAVQLWVVLAGRAQVLKLAHDEALRAASPGTVLTGWVIRRLFETEMLTELDFGRGDDAYKQAWAGQRRVRLGLVLANPKTPFGAGLAMRHAGGLTWRKIQKMLSHINTMARPRAG